MNLLSEMEFIIHQYVDDLVVYNDQKEFMKVKRKTNWYGKVISHFYQNEELIFVSTYNVFLLRKSIAIKFQKLAEQVSLTRHRGNFMLTKSDDLFSIGRSIKAPRCILFENGHQVGDVSIKGFQLPPYVYRMNFVGISQNNFYLLLLFLMDLSPTL